MTVRAANVAFLDFGRDGRPRLAYHKQRDVLPFGGGITVIELQRDDVGLSAVNARMRTQVGTQKSSVLFSAAAISVNLA
jgi:hypothetical protein